MYYITLYFCCFVLFYHLFLFNWYNLDHSHETWLCIEFGVWYGYGIPACSFLFISFCFFYLVFVDFYLSFLNLWFTVINSWGNSQSLLLYVFCFSLLLLILFPFCIVFWSLSLCCLLCDPMHCGLPGSFQAVCTYLVILPQSLIILFSLKLLFGGRMWPQWL